MKSKLITVGDEILIGQVVNTNAAFIGEKMTAAGIPLKKTVVVGDSEKSLLEEFEDALKYFDVTIITGGLGPTSDDITKPALLKFFNDNLVMNWRILRHVKKIFQSRNLAMPSVNIGQAMLPSKSKAIWNPNGTAPGIWIERKNKIFVVLPGVPHEMKAMMADYVVPLLLKRFKREIKNVHKYKTLLTTGLGESTLYQKVIQVEKKLGASKLAYLPSPVGVRIRIDASGNNKSAAGHEILRIEKLIKEKIGDYIFGESDSTIEEVVAKIFTKGKKTLSIAESCTGGMLSSLIVSVAGASKFYLGGICAYSNREKMKLLQVKNSTLKKFGAVSRETAIEMADGIRKLMKTDFALSTTGVAGPTGGSRVKPVGLVWIGFSSARKTYAAEFKFGSNRQINIARASQRAIEILRRELLGIKIYF